MRRVLLTVPTAVIKNYQSITCGVPCCNAVIIQNIKLIAITVAEVLKFVSDGTTTLNFLRMLVSALAPNTVWIE